MTPNTFTASRLRRVHRTRISSLVLVLALLAAAGCSTDGSPTGPTIGVGGPPSTPRSAVLPLGTPLTGTQEAMLAGALQDEYHAQAVYEGVLTDLGSVVPFANIVRAEQNHATSLVQLFVSRGLVSPASAWAPANVPHFRTLAEACSAAATAERDNIALYDGYLASELPLDVQNVFANNRAASLTGHLPAFERCR